MEYIREFVPWIVSWNTWFDPEGLALNVTQKIDGLRDSLVHIWRSDDWQIRLSCFFLVCATLNFVFIAIAWNIYGETISKMLYSKPRTSLHQRLNTNPLSKSMEDLIAKKIQ